MTVLMYQHRFAEPIKSGRKRQTIRPERKRPIQVGDALSHRIWEGKAYRSPQVEIAAGKCTAVFPVEVCQDYVAIGTDYVATIHGASGALNDFARADGFESWADMLAYFNEPPGYGLPFTGVLIQWE